MSYEHPDSVDALDGSDPHHLLFGHDDDHPGDPHRHRRSGELSRHQRRLRRRRRRRRRFVLVMALMALVIVGVSSWFIVRPIVSDQLATKDYSGAGTGDVQIRVNSGDGASDIAVTLKKDGVIRTERAFTNAAKSNPDSLSIQPGVYLLHRQMAADQALALLISSDPIKIKVSIPEGTTEMNVVTKLAAALDLSEAAVRQAAADVANIGLPDGYTQHSALPASAEGFLFPDTYNFDPGTSAADALQQMTSEFTAKDRSLKFASTAAAVKLTPYQALIVASMIEGEAKFPEDRAKVARVIFNRMAKKMPLGIDATSIYGAELAGKDPAKIDYDVPAPYNTRNSSSLPPTPIGNPGAAALTAAVQPARGKWLFYVNGDAAGHLYFTADEAQFAAAVTRCQTHHWGCS